MDFLNGRLQAFLGPPGAAGAPDDLETVIVDFIDQSEHTLDVAVQELDNPRIAAAVDRAARRKRPGTNNFVRVRWVTEGDYLKEDKPVAPPDKEVSLDINRNHFVTLLRGAVDAKIDFNPKIFHHKFIIRDMGEVREAVLTGSTNFTTTDTHRNLNHIVIFHDVGVAAAYQSEFDQLRDGIFGERSTKLTSTDPLTLDIEGSPVQIMFSPDNNPELRIVNEILKAQTSAYFMMFTFAKSTTIDDVLITKLQGGNFEVVGVLDGGQSAHSWSPHKTLLNEGAKLRRETLPNGGKLHHKLIVLDDHTVIGGSFNYTGPANQYNDENLFLVRDPNVAAFFKTEVKRVFESNSLSADFQ
ncbi:MAG TPA: phospholipase D-like domain-containing protein [Anaerolineales bacterium]|nr:phospholipase D-like domain-containing protein [Anaerolineales bacterium]